MYFAQKNMRNYYQISFDVKNIDNERFRIWLGASIRHLLNVSYIFVDIQSIQIEYPTETTFLFSFIIIGDNDVDKVNYASVLRMQLNDILRGTIDNILPKYNRERIEDNKLLIYYTLLSSFEQPLDHPNRPLSETYSSLLDTEVGNRYDIIRQFELFVLEIEED